MKLILIQIKRIEIFLDTIVVSGVAHMSYRSYFSFQYIDKWTDQDLEDATTYLWRISKATFSALMIFVNIWDS